MTDKPSDEFMEAAAMISMEWFDITPVAQELQEQYRLGFEAGKAASLIDADQLKAEYQRGRDDYRNELLRRIDPHEVIAAAPAAPKAPIASSIEEKAPDAKPAPVKNTGGWPNKSGRPEGLPFNLDMAVEAIKALNNQASAPQILAYIRKKWWANFPSSWTAVLYDFVKQKKLARSGINFVLPPSMQVEAETVQKIVEAESTPSKSPATGYVMQEFKPRVPDPGKKLGPPARAQQTEVFEHDGQKVTLHSREYLLTSKLYGVKGQHIGTQFLAQNALGIKDRSTDSESLIRDLVSVINPKIEGMGLKIGFYKGAGFIMQDAG